MTTSRRNTIMSWMAYTEFFYPGCELQPGYFYLSIPELYYIPEDGACIGAVGVDAYHEIIVVERSTTINVYTRGRHSDINGVETPGTVAGMGGGNSGLQEQWFICPAVVQGEGNHTNHLLSLGTRTIIYFWFNDAPA